MHILLVEDSSRFSDTLSKVLEMSGNTVRTTVNISRAYGYLSLEEFDCLIVDLNMRTTGLSSDQIEMTVNGLCTGWIWLKNHVFSKPEYEKYINKTIIVTSYLDEFIQLAPQEAKTVEEMKIPVIPREELVELQAQINRIKREQELIDRKK